MKHTAPTFFDLENQFDKIYQLNGFLPKLKQIIPWEIFRPTLEPIRNKERLSNAGRKPFDVVLMFKIIVLQTIYNLGIEQTELQIRDRLSFRDFLDLAFAVPVPDAKTIWLFAEQLKQQGIEQQLFDHFHQELDARGCGYKKLTDEQRLMNKVKSGIRCRVEHIFGAMWVRCRDGVMRTVGFIRAVFWIGMRNLAYNLSRLLSLPKTKGV